MDYAAKGDLLRFIQKNSALSEPVAQRLFCELASGEPYLNPNQKPNTIFSGSLLSRIGILPSRLEMRKYFAFGGFERSTHRFRLCAKSWVRRKWRSAHVVHVLRVGCLRSAWDHPRQAIRPTQTRQLVTRSHPIHHGMRIDALRRFKRAQNA